LHDPVVSAAAVEALRSLIDAIVVHPGERRGEVRVELRGDLMAFLHLEGEDPASRPAAAKAGGPGWGNSGSGRMMGSLVAGGMQPLMSNSIYHTANEPPSRIRSGMPIR